MQFFLESEPRCTSCLAIRISDTDAATRGPRPAPLRESASQELRFLSDIFVCMARKVVTEYFDDIDGTPLHDHTTTTFALDGRHWQIDLSAANAEKLRAALAPFIAAGRPAKDSTGSRRARSRRGVERPGIREWAAGQGFTVSSRGRLSVEIVDAYDAAHRGRS